MNIVIFEDNHYELAYTVSKIFQSESNRVHIFCTEGIYRLFMDGWQNQLPANTFIYTHPHYVRSENFRESVKTLFRKETIDFAFFTTISFAFKEYYQLIVTLPSQKVLNLHNLNTWLAPALKFNPLERAVQRYQRLILGKVDRISVIDDTIVPYYKNILKYDKPIVVIPFLIFEERHIAKPETSPVTIVVPGAVEAKRRDYFVVFDALKKLRHRRSDFKLILLGKINLLPRKPLNLIKFVLLNALDLSFYRQQLITRKIKQTIAEMQHDGFCIQCYDSYINQREYEEVMRTAAVLISPVNVVTSYDGNVEVYGETKSSGTVFDFIRYAKPGVTPFELKVSERMKQSIYRYKSKEDLTVYLDQMISNKRFLFEQHEKALNSSRNYREDTIREEVLAQLQSGNH